MGRHFVPADISYFFLTAPLDSLSCNMYNVLHPVILSGLAYTPTRVVYIYGYLYIAQLITIPESAFGYG